MEYRTLGETGLRVSAYCLGTWMFGRQGNANAQECVTMLRTALDAGVNFIDTADAYSEGEAESIVGSVIHARRGDVILASKVGYRTAHIEGSGGLSRQSILRSVEASLQRLRTDYLDIYFLHRPDPETDLEESLKALDDLVRAGKIRFAGCSTFPAWQIAESRCARGHATVAQLKCEQPPYSILVRGAELDTFPVAQRYGMGVTVWSPLAGGWLTGKYRRGSAPPPGSRAARADDFATENLKIGARYDLASVANAPKFAAIDRLGRLADEAGLALSAMALAFVQAHPAVTSAVIGARTHPQLVELLRYVDTRLDDALLDRIDEIVPPGAVLNEADRGWDPPWMHPALRRRTPS